MTCRLEVDLPGLGIISVKTKCLLPKGICLKKKKNEFHRGLWEGWSQILHETWDLILGVRWGHTGTHTWDVILVGRELSAPTHHSSVFCFPHDSPLATPQFKFLCFSVTGLTDFHVSAKSGSYPSS